MRDQSKYKNIYEYTTIDINGCMNWTGLKNTKGYGRINHPDFPHETLAHRVSFLINNLIPLPKGICVLHRCDNPGCINPKHLFSGTKGTNNKDRASKGRTVTPTMNMTHCKRGHEFNEENVGLRKTGDRYCRICHNHNQRRRRNES